MSTPVETPPQRERIITRPPNIRAAMNRRTYPSALAAHQAPLSTSLAFDTLVGSLAHTVIAATVARGRDLDPSALTDLITDATAEALKGHKVARAAAARIRVGSTASHYIQRLAPPPFVAFVGSERPVGGGRVDLVWEHPTLGVFFDEIKTWKNPPATIDAATRRQVTRYAEAAATFGQPFAGVRLLPVNAAMQAMLFTPGGRVAALTDSLLSPAALAAQHTALRVTGGDLASLPAAG